MILSAKILSMLNQFEKELGLKIEKLKKEKKELEQSSSELKSFVNGIQDFLQKYPMYNLLASDANTFSKLNEWIKSQLESHITDYYNLLEFLNTAKSNIVGFFNFYIEIKRFNIGLKPYISKIASNDLYQEKNVLTKIYYAHMINELEKILPEYFIHVANNIDWIAPPVESQNVLSYSTYALPSKIKVEAMGIRQNTMAAVEAFDAFIKEKEKSQISLEREKAKIAKTIIKKITNMENPHFLKATFQASDSFPENATLFNQFIQTRYQYHQDPSKSLAEAKKSQTYIIKYLDNLKKQVENRQKNTVVAYKTRTRRKKKKSTQKELQASQVQISPMQEKGSKTKDKEKSSTKPLKLSKPMPNLPVKTSMAPPVLLTQFKTQIKGEKIAQTAIQPATQLTQLKTNSKEQMTTATVAQSAKQPSVKPKPIKLKTVNNDYLRNKNDILKLIAAACSNDKQYLFTAQKIGNLIKRLGGRFGTTNSGSNHYCMEMDGITGNFAGRKHSSGKKQRKLDALAHRFVLDALDRAGILKKFEINLPENFVRPRTARNHIRQKI